MFFSRVFFPGIPALFTFGIVVVNNAQRIDAYINVIRHNASIQYGAKQCCIIIITIKNLNITTAGYNKRFSIVDTVL